MDEIEYEGVKKGFFHNVILTPRTIRDWPEVIFYYSSKASGLESDYLLNIRSWPVVHVRVMEEFKKRGIRGVQYLAVKLVDVATHLLHLPAQIALTANTLNITYPDYFAQLF